MRFCVRVSILILVGLYRCFVIMISNRLLDIVSFRVRKVCIRVLCNWFVFIKCFCVSCLLLLVRCNVLWWCFWIWWYVFVLVGNLWLVYGLFWLIWIYCLLDKIEFCVVGWFVGLLIWSIWLVKLELYIWIVLLGWWCGWYWMLRNVLLEWGF